jgi:hypothetical protein
MTNKKTHIARNIDGKVAPFYLAYRVSHRWGGALEEHSEDREHIIDADVDANVLRERVNAYFATPQTMRFERGNRHEIPAFAMISKPLFGSGGGCNYNAHIEIREAPMLPTKQCPDCDGKGQPVMYGPKCVKCGGSGLI